MVSHEGHETLVTHVFVAGSTAPRRRRRVRRQGVPDRRRRAATAGRRPGRPHPRCAVVAHDLRPPTGVSMSEHLTTDVLVIGCGPAGASAALSLATLGVDHIVITKYRWTANTPRAHITNQRTVEIMRDLGIEDDILANGTPQRLMGDTVFCTSLAGDEIGRVRTWGTHPARQADYTLASPTEPLRPPADAARADPDRPRRRPRLADPLRHRVRRARAGRRRRDRHGAGPPVRPHLRDPREVRDRRRRRAQRRSPPTSGCRSRARWTSPAR